MVRGVLDVAYVNHTNAEYADPSLSIPELQIVALSLCLLDGKQPSHTVLCEPPAAASLIVPDQKRMYHQDWKKQDKEKKKKATFAEAWTSISDFIAEHVSEGETLHLYMSSADVWAWELLRYKLVVNAELWFPPDVRVFISDMGKVVETALKDVHHAATLREACAVLKVATPAADHFLHTSLQRAQVGCAVLGAINKRGLLESKEMPVPLDVTTAPTASKVLEEFSVRQLVAEVEANVDPALDGWKMPPPGQLLSNDFFPVSYGIRPYIVDALRSDGIYTSAHLLRFAKRVGPLYDAAAWYNSLKLSTAARAPDLRALASALRRIACKTL